MENNTYVPKEGDTYWYIGDNFRVTSATYVDSYDNLLRVYQHNCFLTEELATAAADSIKALLQEFTGMPKVSTGDRLNKLTAEVFDHPDCPKWAKYAAVDEDGEALFFEEMPFLATKTCGCFLRDCKDTIIPGKFDSSDWQNSLIERPVKENKLPDWCKVGAVGYNPETDLYFSIDNIDEDGISLRYPYGSDNTSSLTFEYFKECRPVQARLRPYTPEELEGLVGQVLKHSTGSYLVSAFENHRNRVEIESIWHDVNELLSSWTHPDGRPCGKLEHPEGEEWID